MKKRVVVFGLVSLVSLITGAFFVRLAEANPYWWYAKVPSDEYTKPPVISIFSPANNTVFNEDNVTLSFQVDVGESKTALDTLLLSVVYETDWEHDNDNRFAPWNYTSFLYEVNLTRIPEGNHSITIQTTEKGTYKNATAFTIDSSKTVFFIIDTNTATEEIPEFPSWTPMLLTVVALVATLTVYKRKLRNPRNKRGADLRVRSTTVAFLILSLSLSAIMSPCVLGAEDSWKTKTSTMPRRELGVTTVKGKVYAIGGLNRETCLKTNMEYDPKTNKWTLRESMPTARANVAIAAYQNKIYVIGGSTEAGAMERYGFGLDYTKNNATAVNEAYDTETDTWETKQPMPKPRWGASASVVNGKIYVMGGFKADGTPTNDTQIYDPETDSWTEKASIPTRVGGHASAAVNSSIYVCGGTTQWMNGLAELNFTQVYDTEKDAWSYGSPMPRTPSFPAAAATSGLVAPQRVYVISYPNITQVYNPENDTWNTGAEMHTNRCTFGVAAVNDRIYVIGGGSALFPELYFSGENEEYTPFGYIPEFPACMLVPLFVAVTFVVVGVKRKLFRPT